MFSKNYSSYINTIFDPDYIRLLSEDQGRELKNSIYSFVFYNVVNQINECNFKPLYNKSIGASNSPVNVLVGALILKELFNISIDQLMDGIKYNIGFKYALGLSSLSEKPFCRATLFNFQAALSAYSKAHPDADNPLDLVRQNLTQSQIKEFGIKTDIQRIDSVRLQSNIRKYSRLQLLVECLQRLLRILEPADRQECESLVANFDKHTSEHLMYTLSSTEVPQKISDFGYMARTLLAVLRPKYKTKTEFKTMQTVFNQHFKIGSEKGIVCVLKDEELKGDNIQSPDDTEVSYGTKGKTGDTSYSVSLSETCHPENDFNLITSAIVDKNSVTDAAICPKQINKILEITPLLDELHTDAGYGGPESDLVCDQHDIVHVQTAIKGVVPAVEYSIEAVLSETETEPDTQKPKITTYRVACPEQAAEVKFLKKRYKASFDLNKCKDCQLIEVCTSYKNNGVLMIDKPLYLKTKRLKNVRTLPVARRKLRNNVESLMKSVKGMCLNGKLRIRGKINTTKAVCTRIIAINIGRIFRYVSSSDYKKAKVS